MKVFSVDRLFDGIFHHVILCVISVSLWPVKKTTQRFRKTDENSLMAFAEHDER